MRKHPSDTDPPVVGSPRQRSSVWDLVRPAHRAATFYEAAGRGGALRLLWMECVRLGVRMAYPCVLDEEGSAPLVYASGGEGEAEENAALIRRWEELDIAGTAASLEITELDRAAFRKKYREYLPKYRSCRVGAAGSFSSGGSPSIPPGAPGSFR